MHMLLLLFSALLLSVGQKKSHGTDAVAKIARDTESAGPRSRPPIAPRRFRWIYRAGRARRGTGGFGGWKAGDAARDRSRSRLALLLLLLLLSHAKIFCALLLCIRRRAFSAPGRIDTADVITPSAGGARPLQDAHAGEIGAGGAAWAFAAGQYASDGPRAGRRRRACVGSRLHEYVESFECMQTLTRMLPVSAVRSTQCVRRHS